MASPAAPLVTCVLTAFDYADFVERAVASALDQHGIAAGAIEVIAVDDGSTDGTLELLEAMGDPVRVVRQRQLGPAVGTNRGIAEARGRYVALLDADDEWLPDKLERQIELLEARPEVGLVYGDMEVVDGRGRVLQPSNFAWTRQTPAVGRALGTFLGRNLATTSTIVLRADDARAVPPAPEWAWCRDWWLAGHVAQARELDCIPEPVTRYRMHGRNLSALEAAEDEKTLRLWHRDVRVRRIFLRELDLSSVPTNEIEAAWRRFVYFASQVAGGRGVTPREILPVTHADRAEARAALAAAREVLTTDPVAAGHAAARALAADPFGSEAPALLADASRRAEEPAHRRAPLRSAAQAARIRELGARRAAVTATADLVGRMDAFGRFDAMWRMLATTGAPAGELLPSSDVDRDRAMDDVEKGLRAAVAGRYDAAVLALTAAVARDPGDEHARLALEDAVARVTGLTTRRSRDEAGASRAHAPTALEGARSFVGLAFADELAADPGLVSSWTAAFAEDDDATLAIYAPGRDEADVVAGLERAFVAAGIGVDDGRDMIAVVAPPTAELEADLARTVHVLLTRRPATAPFANLPITAGDALRDSAARRWSYDGLGRPISVAVKLCARRWQDAQECAELPLALALAAELERRGHYALVQVAEEWDDREGRHCDVALHLRGAWPYLPHAGHPSVICVSAGAPTPTARELARYDARIDGNTPEVLCDGLLRAVALAGGRRPVPGRA